MKHGNIGTHWRTAWCIIISQESAVQKIVWYACYRNLCTEAPVSQNSTEDDDLEMYIIRDDPVQMGFC